MTQTHLVEGLKGENDRLLRVVESLQDQLDVLKQALTQVRAERDEARRIAERERTELETSRFSGSMSTPFPWQRRS